MLGFPITFVLLTSILNECAIIPTLTTISTSEIENSSTKYNSDESFDVSLRNTAGEGNNSTIAADLLSNFEVSSGEELSSHDVFPNSNDDIVWLDAVQNDSDVRSSSSIDVGHSEGGNEQASTNANSGELSSLSLSHELNNGTEVVAGCVASTFLDGEVKNQLNGNSTSNWNCSFQKVENSTFGLTSHFVESHVDLIDEDFVRDPTSNLSLHFDGKNPVSTEESPMIEAVNELNSLPTQQNFVHNVTLNRSEDFDLIDPSSTPSLAVSSELNVSLFNVPSNVDLSNLDEEAKPLDNDTTVLEGVSSLPFFNDTAPTIESVKECPAPGLCLMWFLGGDSCSSDSHCPRSSRCCKVRCFKSCISV